MGRLVMVPLDDSGIAYCLARAREMRQTADKCRDPLIKEQLLYVARKFEALSAAAANWQPDLTIASERELLPLAKDLRGVRRAA